MSYPYRKLLNWLGAILVTATVFVVNLRTPAGSASHDIANMLSGFNWMNCCIQLLFIVATVHLYKEYRKKAKQQSAVKE